MKKIGKGLIIGVVIVAGAGFVFLMSLGVDWHFSR